LDRPGRGGLKPLGLDEIAAIGEIREIGAVEPALRVFPPVDEEDVTLAGVVGRKLTCE
jgi:hypothetical protein